MTTPVLDAIKASEALIEQLKRERKWLAQQVVEAHGRTTRDKYSKPPEKHGFPQCKNKEEAVSAWIEEAEKQAKEATPCTKP